MGPDSSRDPHRALSKTASAPRRTLTALGRAAVLSVVLASLGANCRPTLRLTCPSSVSVGDVFTTTVSHLGPDASYSNPTWRLISNDGAMFSACKGSTAATCDGDVSSDVSVSDDRLGDHSWLALAPGRVSLTHDVTYELNGGCNGPGAATGPLFATCEFDVVAASHGDTDVTPDTDTVDTDVSSGDHYTVTVSVGAVGTVTSLPEGVHCASVSSNPDAPTTCTATLPAGSVTLNTVPDTGMGYTRTTFTGCTSTDDLTCTFELSADTTIGILFTDAAHG